MNKAILALLQQYRDDLERSMRLYGDGMAQLGPGREWAFGGHECAEVSLIEFDKMLKAIVEAELALQAARE